MSKKKAAEDEVLQQEETAAELKKYKEDYFNAYNAGKRLKEENASLKEEIQNLKIRIAKLEGGR